MKKIMHSFVLLLIAVFFFSCSGNPFMTNIFSSIDVYTLPDSFESAEDILDEAGDDGFLDALAEDPDLAAVVIIVLEDSLPDNPAEADADDQEAALLLADVHLATTDADDTVNNVNDLLTDLVTGGGEGDSGPDFENPDTIITDLFVLDPAMSAQEQEEAVAAQLEAFLAAADALSYYGDTMVDGGLEPSSEVNPGETASTGMISGMTSYLIVNMDQGAISQEIKDANPGATEEQLAIAALTDVIVNGSEMPTVNDSPEVAALPEDATIDEMMDAMLGEGLAEVVAQGFDLSAMENM